MSTRIIGQVAVRIGVVIFIVRLGRGFVAGTAAMFLSGEWAVRSAGMSVRLIMGCTMSTDGRMSSELQDNKDQQDRAKP